MKGKRFWYGVFSLLIGFAMLAASFMPASADGSKTIWCKALVDHECNDTEWHFVITQVSSEELAPGSILVSWANGSSETVPLDKFTGGTAHYSTTSNLDSSVTSASAEIYSEWDGQFNLSHGPCHSNPTPTSTATFVIPTNTPTTVILTLTSTATATDTNTPTATATEIILTLTPTPTGEVTVTASPTASATATPTTVILTLTPTSTGEVTVTASPTASPTATQITVTPSPTTPSSTSTPTSTGTVSVTLTATNTPKPPQTGFVEDIGMSLSWLRLPGGFFTTLGLALISFKRKKVMVDPEEEDQV